MKEFKIRCSKIVEIMGGNGITELQAKKITELQNKPKRTDKQGEELQRLIEKRDNPQLPPGAKTYCKTWVMGQLYKRSKNISKDSTTCRHSYG